ncbi:MAG: 16S rRNA (guanine(527)-N(7))-methyltransferase RsmG [Mycoplasmoidaceae bacterium]
MNKDTFKKEILNNFKCNENLFEKIELYKEILIENNKKYNLTRLEEEEKIYLNYFFESIIVYKDILENKDYKLLDIGSGSGIPGVLIKLFYPKINVTIIESNKKKCDFMKLLIDKLELQGINVICKRAEILNNNERETFDYVTSRAVSSLKVLIEISTPYLKINGLLIEPKSTNIDNELFDAKEIIKELKLTCKNLLNYNFFDRKHNIAIFEKTEKTSIEYPRMWKDIVN